MNIKEEMEFLKEVSLGLFAKKHIEFTLQTKPHGDGKERHIEIHTRDNRYITVGNNIDLQIIYLTGRDSVYVSRNTYGVKTQNVPKKDAVSTIKSMLLPQKEEYGSEYSESIDIVNFYDIIEQLSEQVFTSPDRFELNVTRNSFKLAKKLGVSYKDIEDSFSVYGGVGSAEKMDDLVYITTGFEFGKSPNDNKNYLYVLSNIVENAKRPAGYYPDATVDMFIETMVEQYQKAWNRTQ